MLIIAKNETITWLTERRLLDREGQLLHDEFRMKLEYIIPGDSGKKTALSKIIASFFDNDVQALLWIYEFGIWPSCEDRNLFDGFRRSLGESQPISMKPGHIFSNSDLDSLASLLSMVLYFCWGAIVISTANDFVIKISHDEIINVFTKDQKTFSEIQGKLNKLLK